MTDIVERLRWEVLTDASASRIIDDAISEIESLRSRLADLEAGRALIVTRAENAEAALAYAASTGDECAIEVEALRKDAERYRWLVSQGDPILWDYLGGMDDDQIDEAIDKWLADDAETGKQPRKPIRDICAYCSQPVDDQGGVMYLSGCEALTEDQP